MNKVKNITITGTNEQQSEAQKVSKEIFGKVNVSGLFWYFLNLYKKGKL